MGKRLANWGSLSLRNCCRSFWDPQAENGVNEVREACILIEAFTLGFIVESN